MSIRPRHLLFAMSLVCLFLSFPAFADEGNACTSLIPPGGAYDRLRINFSKQSRDYLDEIIYIKDFGSHDEALNYGLSVGTILYGVPLQVGGTVDQKKKEEWRKEYESRRIHDVQEDVKLLLSSDKLNVEVVRIIADCIVASNGGLWISAHTTDECNLLVRAGYVPDSVPGPKVVGVLKATNATCHPLDKTPLPPKGFSSNCVRGTAAKTVVVTVHTSNFGDRDVTMDGFAEPKAPVIQETTERRTARQDLSRGQADQVYGDQNCPDCQTKYGIHFIVPGPIADMQLLNGPPAFVWQCPDGGKCGNIPRLFSRPDGQPCNGSSECWVWFLERNNNTPAVYGVNVSYDLTRHTCTANCRTSALDENAEMAAYKNAHDAWTKMQSQQCKKNDDLKAKVRLNN